MRCGLVVVGLAAGAWSGCAGEPSFDPESPELPLRPVTRTVRIQAARSDGALFLRARWVDGARTATLSAAVSPRGRDDSVRDFPALGCFVACHDVTRASPPSSGNPVVMFLFEGFGGPLDVWLAAVSATGRTRAEDLSITTAGIRRDAASRVQAVGAAEGEVRQVLLLHEAASDSAAVHDVAIALHTGGLGGRHHYVSLPIPLRPTEVEAVPGLQDFDDQFAFPVTEVALFLPGITTYDFLVGALREPDGDVRTGDRVHAGRRDVATGSLGCSDCHRVRSTDPAPSIQRAGALERLVLRRGGVFGPSILEAR